jgi:outer membrane protein
LLNTNSDAGAVSPACFEVYPMSKALSPFVCFTLLALLLAAPASSHAADTQSAPPTDAQAPAAVSVEELKQPEAVRTEHSVKIGYVDLTRFGTETEAGKAAREKVRKKSERLESQVNARQKQLEKQKAALQIKLPSLSPKEQEAKAKEFEKKVDELRKFLQNAEKEMKGFEAEVTRQLYQDIEEAASAFGKTNGYDAIVVKRELLFVGNGVEGQDVTAGVLKLMNVRKEKK